MKGVRVKTTAKNYTPGPRKSPIRLVVIHTMESQEKPGTSKRVAAWFSGPTAPRASAHLCVDDKDVVRVVEDSDIAWGAPGGNSDGLHIELAGTASQNSSEWSDAYSQALLQKAASAVADWCRKYSIPVRRLTPSQIQDKRSKGICGHVDVTLAFPEKGSHVDPGKNFPWDLFLNLVHQSMTKEK
jgi:N-acetyl-anhydromuramyl-L-alanine amidase AmpD